MRVKLGISFLGTLALFITTMVFHQLIYGHPIGEHLGLSTVIMVFVYMVIGLSIDKHNNVCDLIDRILYIQDNGDSEDAKLQLIKSFIEINVNKWVAYWHIYQEIVEGKEKSGGFKRFFARIYKGSLSFTQFIWIMCYIIFNVFKEHLDVFNFLTIDIIFVIDFIGLGFFILTSGDVLGTKEFMTILFESIKPGDDKTVSSTLKLLESNIIYGARQYGFLKRSFCVNENNEVKRNGI